MKRKIFIIEEYEKGREREVRQLLWGFLSEGEINLLIRMKYERKALSKESIESMAEVIRSLGKEKEFTVDLELVTDQWDLVRKNRKILNQYSIRVELRVRNDQKRKEVDRYKEKLLLERICIVSEEYPLFLKLYEEWKNLKIPICSEYELTTAEYLEFFQTWLRDNDAVWYTPFEDIFVCLLTGNSSSDCVHQSCMGKYLYLDDENYVYFCAQKRAAAKMYLLSEGITENLYNDVYDQWLNRAVEKRNHCLEECGAYSLCKGGCVLEEKTSRYCAEFAQKIACAAQVLERELESAFLNVENACLRQLYLSLVAYGFQQEEL